MGLINGLVIPANLDEDMYLRTFVTKFNDDSEHNEIAFRALRHVIGCQTIEVLPVQEQCLLKRSFRDYSAFGDEEGRFGKYVVNHRATMIIGFPYDLVGTIVVIRYKPDQGDSSMYRHELTHLQEQGLN